MTHETRMKRLRSIGASALRDGDTATAQAIIGILEGRPCGQVQPFALARSSDAKSAAERAAAYRARKRDASRESVTASRDGERDGERDVLRDVEGGKGGGDLGISRDSLGSETEIQDQKTLPETSLSLTLSGRARARGKKPKAPRCPCPPLDELVDAALLATCVAESLPDPRLHYEQMVDIYAKSGTQWCGVGGWRAAYRGILRENRNGWPVIDAKLEESKARLAAHRARSVASDEPATQTPGPEVHDALAALDTLASHLTTPRTFKEDTA